MKAPNSKEPVEIFKSALALYRNAFCYCWYHPKVGLWIGATPEVLLKVVGLKCTTMSLAGTQPYKPDALPEWSTKEHEEQHLVTRFVREVLASELINLKISKQESSRAGQLWHLKNTFTGELSENSSLATIISALHPTPAVCGLPKTNAKRFILDNEGYDRSFYTGFLGPLHPNQPNVMDQDRPLISLYVNLRCMKLVDNTAYVFVGGGITADSDLEKEWQETLNKSRTMLNCL